MEPIAPTDPLSHSADLTTENIERLRELFPQAVTEDGAGKRIDFDVLRELLGGELATGEEKYGLNWHGKRAARRLALTPSTGTLRPAPEDSVDWDTTQNLMIEGDNLEVLKLLQKSYAGKVKMIYIDPPYNTGKDFVYKDDFRDSIGNYQRITGQRDAEGAKLTTNAEGSGRFHTDWLNMMYPRLMLARNLLRDDGVIVCSIDDAELQHLETFFAELFGEENGLAVLVWDRNRKNDAKYFSVGHEYMVVFAKSKQRLIDLKTIFREPKVGIDEAQVFYEGLKKKFGDDFEAIAKEWKDFFRSLSADDPRKPLGRFSKIGLKGPFRDDGDISWPGGGGPKYQVLHPVTQKPCKVPAGGWVYGTPETFWEEVGRDRVVFGPDETTLPRQQRFLFDGDGQVMQSVHFSYAQTATFDFVELMGDRVFDNPKHWDDLRRLVQYITIPGDLIVDFFAGSGSLGHAVYAQNAIETSTRRFLLVQLQQQLDPEKKDQLIAASFCNQIRRPRNLAEITKERLRRAATKIKKANSLFHGDLGFRVFKLDTTSIRPWDPTLPVTEQRLLEEVDNILPGRTEQDLLYELLLKRGLELTVPIVVRTLAGKQVFAVSTGDLIACLAPHIESPDVEALAEGIVTWHKELAPPPAIDPNAPLEKPAKFDPPLVVFRDTAFADDVAKSNLTEILKQHNLTDVRSL